MRSTDFEHSMVSASTMQEYDPRRSLPGYFSTQVYSHAY